jgi:hypothetical protein
MVNGTLTDGTASMTGGTVTATTVTDGTTTMTGGTVTATTLTDGTTTVTGGTVTATTLTDGTTTVTGGTVTATTLTDGTAACTAGAVTGVTTFASAGDMTVTTAGSTFLVDVSEDQIFLPNIPFANAAVTETAGTGGALTLTAAVLTTSLCIFSDPVGSGNYTTDTAANIVAAIPNARVGDSWAIFFVNNCTNADADVITFVGGAGVTVHSPDELGGATCTGDTNNHGVLVFRLTNVTAAAEAVDLFWCSA